MMNESNKTERSTGPSDVKPYADGPIADGSSRKKQFRRRVRSDKPPEEDILTDDFLSDDDELSSAPPKEPSKSNNIKAAPVVPNADSPSPKAAPSEPIADINVLSSVSIWQAQEEQAQSVQAKKFKKITAVLFMVGAAATVCLVFFFYTLFNVRSSSDIPKIIDAQQLGATDSSVLLSWSSAGPSDGYRIRLNDGNGTTFVSDCDLPFAVLRHLQPNREYSVELSALKEGAEYGAQTVTCVTESYCEITKVKVSKVGSDSVTVSWEYEGANQGFETVAYALDANGRRHLTSQKVTVSADSKPQCKISGLAAELQYTVAVMPLTRYGKVGKSTFTTAKYSKEFDQFNIIRFVICKSNVQDAVQVQALKKIKPSSPYKASLILNGKTDKKHKVDIAILITDTDGNLIGERQYGEIYTNPDGKEWFFHRSYLFDFTTPEKQGDYYMYLTVNGQSVYKTNFTVEN